MVRFFAAAVGSIPNIILAGTLFHRPYRCNALTRLASNHPAASGRINSDDFQKIMRGEHRHLILQALCRGAVRKCLGESCPSVNAYVIASSGSGIAHELPAIFPGARIERWRPVATKVKGKAGSAVAFILDQLSKGATEVTFASVKKHVAVANTANFNRNIRRHPALVEALAAEDVIEWPEVRPPRYLKALTASGFGDIVGPCVKGDKAGARAHSHSPS